MMIASRPRIATTAKKAASLLGKDECATDVSLAGGLRVSQEWSVWWTTNSAMASNATKAEAATAVVTHIRNGT